MKGEMPVVLEYFLRVAIQAPAYLASLFPVDKPGVQVVELTMQAAPVDGLQQKVPAVVASLAFNECRQGTVNLDVPHLFQRNFPCLQHEVLDSGGIQPLCPYEDLVAEWRKACLLPQVQFLACKSFVAFSDQCLQQGIVWMLDNGMNSSRLVAWDTRKDALHKIVEVTEPGRVYNSFFNDLALDPVGRRLYAATDGRGVAWLDRQATELGGKDFVSLGESARASVVSRAASADEDSLENVFFSITRADALLFYYARPEGWQGIPGYQGPPQPLGYMDHHRPPGD